ncbi:unnamed protein product [Brassica oleracea var. botrytis]
MACLFTKGNDFKGLWESLDGGRSVVTMASITCLMKCLGEEGFVKEAFYRMKEYHCKPDDVYAYNTIINALCRVGNFKKARFLLDQMQLPITVDMGCRKAIRRRMWEANRMFREMLFRVFAPDVVTYNCLIDGCCKTNRIGRALELFEDMKKRECVPNSVTNEIERGVEMMRMMGHGVPGSSTNTPLIHALLETRRVAEARGDGGGRSSHPNKGSLVKSLREAATTLSQIEQPLVTETVSKKQALKLLEAELKPLKKSIIKHDLLKNLVTCIFVELTAYFVQLSACFPDASKAEDFFHKFDQMDDTSIFDALTLLLDELTFTKAPTIRLSSSTSADTQLKASFIKLLLFSELLEDNDSFADEVTEALSKAAPYISANFSDYSTVLEKMCLEGTRSQAKHAVSAIASLARHLKNLSFPSYARNATREAGGVDQRDVDHSLIVQINMIVFLIHVLAHDPDFPSEDCMDEHVYARFCGPMLSLLLSNKETVLILFSILRAIKRAADACKTPLSLTW